MLRYLLLIILSLSVVGCDELNEFENVEEQVSERMEDNDKKLAALRKVATKVNETAKFNTYFAQCPAASFGKEKSLITSAVKAAMGEDELDKELCLLTPELCLSICLDGDENGCLSLAQALEDVELDDKIGENPGRKAYALACATGSASGCTNRGGGMLNYPIKSDPMSQSLKSSGYACTFSLFQTACTQDDPWGCTMLGEAYKAGQGTKKDLQTAKVKFTKACSLESDGRACEYAKQLDGSVSPSAD